MIVERDRKSTRLNSSHGYISYAVFCLKKKNVPYQRCIPDEGHVGWRVAKCPALASFPCHPLLCCSPSGWRLLPGTFFALFFNDTATTEIYTLSLHDALPILRSCSFGFSFSPRSSSATSKAMPLSRQRRSRQRMFPRSPYMFISLG